jgi:hypothetical protein
MSDELKSCRQCGRKPKLKSRIIDREWGGPAVWRVVCCCGRKAKVSTKEGAIAYWNWMQEDEDTR